MAKQPWNYHSDLSEDRLNFVAELIQRTRDEAASTHQVEKVRWGIGCLIYDQTRNIICEESGKHDWLGIVDSSMSFVFSIGSVPIRFYRGLPDAPSSNTLAINHLELTQLSLAYGTPQAITRWRFAVDTESDGTTLKISLVGFDEYEDVICTWNHNHEVIESPDIKVDKLHKPAEPTIIKPAEVTPRNGSDEGKEAVSSGKA